MKKEKFFLSMFSVLIVTMLASGLVSCSKDDDDSKPTPSPVVVAAVDQVTGSYTGTLKPVGYNDEPARCYVTMTKLSSDAIRLEKLICEEFSLDMNPVNLRITEESDGRITLRSETSKSIEGSYYQGQLTLSFANSLATFYFSGKKN